MKSQQLTDYALVNCRVSARIKSRAEEAAQLLGQSMTDFTESALAEKTQSVFDQHDRILLSERDFSRFVESLENPEPPTQRLKSAMAQLSTMLPPGSTFK